MASSLPGEEGISVIGGHRDTHFAFLRELRTGSLVRVELPGGMRHDYRVTGSHVVDAARETLPLHRGLPTQLLLITCYPFDALRPGGSLRYVVSAHPVGAVPPTAYPL
jgi:sortase A